MYCCTLPLLVEVRILENLVAVVQRNTEESYLNITSVLQQSQLLKLYLVELSISLAL